MDLIIRRKIWLSILISSNAYKIDFKGIRWRPESKGIKNREIWLKNKISQVHVNGQMPLFFILFDQTLFPKVR